MKRSIMAIAVLSSFIISASVVAASGGNSDSGVLKINGRVVGTTCQFIDSNTAEISLNEIGMDKLSDLDDGQIYTPVVNGTQQPLRIKCQGNNTPRVTFSASQFGDKKITFNNGDAKGVGFAVYYGNDSKQIDPAGKMDLDLVKNANDEYELNFFARYARLGTNEVTAGSVSSTLTLTVVTD